MSLKLIYPQMTSYDSDGTSTTLSGLGDLYVYQGGDGIWYIDPSNLTIPATISGGVTLSGVHGITTSFIPTGSGTDGYWLIDPEGIEAGITLEYTTVYGTAGSGNGIFWGTAQFMGASGTNIYHNLGNEDHSVFITPDGQDNFDIDATAMIGEIYVKKREEYDTVYTTGSGSQGQWFSWMVVQGWPWNPNVARDSLTFDTTINTTTSGAFLGEGQDTGLEVTVSGGSWAITYDLAYQLNTTATGISAGYVWLEDGMHIVPNSQRHISTLSPSYNNVTQHISVTSFATTTVPKRYRLYASKDLNLTPDVFKLIGTETISGTKSVSSMITIPMSHLGPPASEQYGSYLTTVYGTDGLYSYWNQGAGAWYVQPDYEEFNLYGENGISITAVSGGLYVDGSDVLGPGGIIYTVGSGVGISWGYATFSGMSGSPIRHDLGTEQHSTQITPGGLSSITLEQMQSLENSFVVRGENEDVVYTTSTGIGIPFTWVASIGLPYYSSVGDHLDYTYTITSGVTQPTFGAGQTPSFGYPTEDKLEISLPQGTWNLFYDISANISSNDTGYKKAWVWVETGNEILDRSIKEITVTSPADNYDVQHVTRAFQITPDRASTYRLCFAKDSTYIPDILSIYGCSTTSGSSSSILAIPGYANGYFGSQCVCSTSGGSSLLIGENGIATSYDALNGEWTIAWEQPDCQEFIDSLCNGWSLTQSGIELLSSTKVDSIESDITVLTQASAPALGAGQYTGIHVTVPSGVWNLFYNIQADIQSSITGRFTGYTWLEDHTTLISGSVLQLDAWAPTDNYSVKTNAVMTRVANTIPTTYKLYSARSSSATPDAFKLKGGAGEEPSSHLLAFPAGGSYALSTSSGSVGSQVSLQGTGMTTTTFSDDVWYIHGHTPSGINGVAVTVSGEYWIVDGNSRINYPNGEGSGVAWGTATFSGETGALIHHGLNTASHATIITPGGDSFTDVNIGTYYVEKGLNADTIYTTEPTSSGIGFSWYASTGTPIGITQRGCLDSDYALTSSSGIPSISFGSGEDTGLSVTVPAGRWNLSYNLSFRSESDLPGLSASYTWIEDDLSVVDNSSSRLTAWNPMMSVVDQTVTRTAYVQPGAETTYRLRAQWHQGYEPEAFRLLATSGNSCCLFATPADSWGTPVSWQLEDAVTPAQLTATSGVIIDYVNSHVPVISGTGGIVTYVSNGVTYVDGTAVQGTGGGGAGASITGDSYFTTSGTSVEHGLSADHYLTVTPTVSGVDDAAKIGTVWIETASGTDMVYCTGQGDADGLPFMWMATPSGSFETTHDELIVTGSGSFTGYSGTVIDHNLGTLDHSTVITPAGTGDWTVNGLTKIGITYVDIGFNQDTVYNTGGDDSTGQPFNWVASKNSAINLLLEGITPDCLECDGDNLTVAGNITATSGTFTDGLTVGSGTVRITGDSIELPNSPPLTSLDRFYKNIVGGRLEYYSDTEIRWEPYESDTIGLWNGTGWELVCPSGIVQAFNDFTTISGGSASVDTNYDVYAKYESADNFTLEFQEWAGNTSRYEDPIRWQGVYVRDLTASGIKMRYLGVIRLDNDSGAKFKDSYSKRFIANFYNKKERPMVKTLTGNDFVYSSNVWRYWNGDSNMKVEFIICSPQTAGIKGGPKGIKATSSTNPRCTVALDTSNSDNLNSYMKKAQGIWGYSQWSFDNMSGDVTITELGYHYLACIQHSSSNTSANWMSYGDGRMSIKLDG